MKKIWYLLIPVPIAFLVSEIVLCYEDQILVNARNLSYAGPVAFLIPASNFLPAAALISAPYG